MEIATGHDHDLLVWVEPRVDLLLHECTRCDRLRRAVIVRWQVALVEVDGYQV